jgi:TolB-like protein/Tfp pilus assembly protein PilF
MASRQKERARPDWTGRLRERGVLRVAVSYAVIAWLVLQIASVVFDPLGVPKWVMTALVIAAAVGFPVAIALAWFLEVGERGVELDTAPEGVARPTTRGLRHYADAIVIGVLLIAVVVLAVRQSDLGKPKPPENPAIAVLPFENLSGDPQQEYFSDGLAEEMLDRLGRVPGLRVIARSSSFSFKGKDLDVKTIAGKLGVTTVLEGSVRRDGKRLKLNARLIDGATGQQAWSGSFDREATDIFAVQAELASAIVNAVIPAARGAIDERPPPPTTDLSAYDLYLLARAQLAIRTPETQHKSLELMNQAIEIDPNFALAHAHRAASLLLLRNFGDPTPEQSADWLREAEVSTHRALALGPGLSEAHDAYATLLRDSGRPGAEEEYKRALELNPNNATAWHDYAVFLGSFAGRLQESIRATVRTLKLDPRYPAAWANYLGGMLAPGSQRYKDEVARAVRTIGDMPDALNGVGIATTQFGYPAETMMVALAKRQLKVPEVAGAWIFEFRAWLPVDLDRAAAALPRVDAPSSRDFPRMVRLYSAAELAGLRGDWVTLDGLFGELRELLGDKEPSVRSAMAFWLAVQGRYDEAAESLAQVGPLPDWTAPPRLGGDTMVGLLEPAVLRIYRETSREQEARRHADELLKGLRADRRAAGTGCDWSGWMRYAGVAANEGLKDEAVDALRGAMRCGDLPYGFRPQLPWFRSLEGYAPYDELVRERERRVERIRTEMLRLEANAIARPQQPGSAAEPLQHST